MYPRERRFCSSFLSSFLSIWLTAIFRNRLVVLYFGITNVLNNANILRYDYGDDYAGRKDQQSIFGRSLLVGMYIPFF